MTSKPYQVHHTALVATDQVGPGTRIWAFCNIQEGVRIGSDCNICDHCFIEQGVVIGDRVTIKNGVALWSGVTLEDDVFVGPGAVFTNDVYPRSKAYLERPATTLVRRGATIGANATVVAGHSIGAYAFIGAGAVLTKDAPDFSLWLGNPARQAGFVCKRGKRLHFALGPGGAMKATGAGGEAYVLKDGLVRLVGE